MSSSARIRVWCEDREHEQFARQLLCDVFQVPRRNLRFETAPEGKGAASKWVEQQCNNAVVPEQRRTKSQQGLGFLVMIDGDNIGVAGRLANLPKRDADDRIAILIPTWSIETWALWLLGEDVDETASVKHLLAPEEFRVRVRLAIANWNSTSHRPKTRVPSLELGRSELERLPL